MCDRVAAQIEDLTGRIDEAIAPFAAQVAQLDEIRGVEDGELETLRIRHDLLRHRMPEQF
jgi:hypothetical protein